MDIINSIIHADVIDGLKQIPDNIITLVITSPPYNVAATDWSYADCKDDLPYLEYLKWLESIFLECKRVLRTGGRLIVNIDAMTNRQSDKADEYVRPIYADLVNILKSMGMKFFGEHAWYKSSKNPDFNGGQTSGKRTAWGSFCSPSTPVIRRNHEYILIFSKDQFQLPKSADSLDPDIKSEEFTNWILSTWSLQPETRNLGNHPVPFTVELPRRLTKLYSYPNDIILDPFSGTGTTAYAAKISNRRYIGIDNVKEYCEYSRKRLASADGLF